MPAAENAASFHFEIDAPKGVQIAEASLLAGRPTSAAKPSFDRVRGGFSTAGLHVIEVPNGSLSRAQVDLQVVNSGWLMTSTLSCWAIFGLLLAFLVHRVVLNRAGDLPVIILLALAGAAVALIAQSDAHPLAAHLLKWTRSLATIVAAVPLIATTFIAFGVVAPAHVGPALSAAVITSGSVALFLSAVCLLSWRRLHRIIISPWEQNSRPQREHRAPPPPPQNYNDAAESYHYTKAAMRVDSAEGWHRDFFWDDEFERSLIAALELQSGRHAGRNPKSFLRPEGNVIAPGIYAPRGPAINVPEC